MDSQRFISRDAAPSNRFVAASCTFPILSEETKHKYRIELYDLESNELIWIYELPVHEIVQSHGCPDIDLLFPTSTPWVPPLLLLSRLPNSTVYLNLDFILHHEGMYEIRLRAEGINGSERRRVFTVEEVND